MSAARRRYVVAYDIREPGRLRRVHKTMKGFGEPLQYSVFVCDLDPVERIRLDAAVGSVINHREDSIVFIDLGDARTRGVEVFEFMGTGHALPSDDPQIV